MRAPARRADNLVSGLLSQARRLSVHVKVCLEAVTAYRRLVSRLWLGFSGIVLLSAGAAWITQEWWLKPEWSDAFNAKNWEALTAPGIALGSALVGASLFWWFLSLGLRKLRRSIGTEEGVDVFFKRAYRDELSLQKRADLHALWETIKPGVLDIMRVHGLSSLSASISSKKLLRKLDSAIEKDIPALRRKMDLHPDFNPEEPEKPEEETAAQTEAPEKES